MTSINSNSKCIGVIKQNEIEKEGNEYTHKFSVSKKEVDDIGGEELNEFEKKLTKEPFLNMFIKRTVEQGDDLLFNDLVSSNHRAILEYFDITTGDTLLHIASKNCHVNILKQIVGLINSYSPTIYTVKQNMLGFTPLMYSIENNHLECTLFLLTCGINNLIAAQTRIENKTALHFLTTCKFSKTYKQMIFNLMHLSLEQINVKTIYGETALDIAMYNENNSLLIKSLLQRGANPTGKYIGNIKYIDNNDFIQEHLMYRFEINQNHEDIKEVMIKSYKKYGQDDINIILLKLKAFINGLNKMSLISDWKKLCLIKDELDYSNIFGDKIFETDEKHNFLNKYLVELELDDFKNHLVILAHAKKLGGQLKEKTEPTNISDENLLLKLFEIKQECIERLERINNKDDTITKIIYKLNEIVF
ncbi:ankyrin repeat protein, putative [Entamoeba histolytica HM-1:IMSS-B]|uniref:Ankyrin repeat protein, putative n=6 Tax=Entamoeba histolytica TaxID=5759 RepID=C4M7T8_ENTH1|nr:ankyrin repeat protein, putative [Entamoeba histolytica HM-1:IMSS]EMD43078.1 ankyrin repeatcontaining protein [Entamoeba histolytica KU27]EMH74858.1 ankyrin repeat protein, putative [Entamoeba histolytica HM-1:IMSS-B]EMS12477.1 ankyrin repeat protein [Entamoeba histolytica HM-3:IMSS]ENY64402.1 ankyrin repeat protein [Entamoeba histolytica HM-1:IMSS-A]GAT97618.1 ankyrin repeat protein putative [Entamoeba histolytica]|eukprot:XP_649187.1 ankyrin repeat protein, putative [Entamoeba histolytica HM-1:IMSS]